MLPGMLAKQTRIGVYGSWYNYYLCEFQGGVVLPSELMDLLPPDVQQSMSKFTVHSSAERCQLMARRSDAKVLRMGAIALVLLLLVMAASFNLQKFPGFRGTTYHAELTDASGLRAGSEVQVAGIRVGRVNKLRIGPEKVIADFDVKDATLGRSTRASVEVKSLLGEKFLNITPKGGGSLPGDSTIPLARTDVTFDIVGTLGTLTTQTEETDKENLTKALNSLAETVDAAAPEVKSELHRPVPPLERRSRRATRRSSSCCSARATSPRCSTSARAISCS